MVNQSVKENLSSQKNYSKILGIFFFILLIFGFLSYNVYQWTIIQKTKKQVQLLSDITAQVNQHLQQQDEQFKTNQTALVYLLSAANQSQDFLALAELESLLHTADLTLNVQHNIPEAIILLKIANQKMRNIQNPKLSTARSLLVQNIIALQAMKMSEITPLFIRIQLISHQIDELPQRVSVRKSEKEIPQTADTKQSFWKNALQSSWGAIRPLLIIQKNDYPENVILTAQEYQAIKLNLRLYLTQAQTALLQRHKKIYQTCLENVYQSIQKYFPKNNDLVPKMLGDLNDLKQIDITPPLPQINHTLSVLENIMHASENLTQQGKTI